MKKNIRDMTAEEIENYCKNRGSCNNCPCLMLSANYKEHPVCAFDLDEFDYEVEVEEKWTLNNIKKQ